MLIAVGVWSLKGSTWDGSFNAPFSVALVNGGPHVLITTGKVVEDSKVSLGQERITIVPQHIEETLNKFFMNCIAAMFVVPRPPRMIRYPGRSRPGHSAKLGRHFALEVFSFTSTAEMIRTIVFFGAGGLFTACYSNLVRRLPMWRSKSEFNVFSVH